MTNQFTQTDNDDQILSASEKAYESGDLALAESGYRELSRRAAYTGWTSFALGRIARDRGDTEEAETLFRDAMFYETTLIWPRYEFIALLLLRNAPGEELARAVRPVLAANLEQLTQQHIHMLERAAHCLCDHGDPALGTDLLTRLWPSEELRQISLGYLVERSGNSQIRRDAAQRLLSARIIHPAVARVIGRYLVETGKRDQAIPLFEQHWHTHRDDVESYMILVRHYRNQSKRRHLETLLSAREEFEARDRSLIELCLEMDGGDAEGAAGLLKDHIARFGEVPEDVARQLCLNPEKDPL